MLRKDLSSRVARDPNLVRTTSLPSSSSLFLFPWVNPAYAISLIALRFSQRQNTPLSGLLWQHLPFGS
ncbi:Hypothetical predicted protein [Marmota monax]|uniref:Uncharacterized protein n=1 Tax=Marmota monax TaxID=9995 RepID=A0A5E4B581_MARMO|nr:Hypothetical predicted protein [Marmota monax]